MTVQTSRLTNAAAGARWVPEDKSFDVKRSTGEPYLGRRDHAEGR
jgi:hypothetical protein